MRNRIAITLGLLIAGLSTGDVLAQDARSAAGFFRFDNRAPWLHGFDRRVSPFRGHASIRPSNYKQALARAGYIQMHASQLHSAYSRRPSKAETYEMRRRLSRHESTSEVAQPTIPNGIMSPLRSIRIARPQVLPAKTTEAPQVIRAIQREEAGPLFPLPR